MVGALLALLVSGAQVPAPPPTPHPRPAENLVLEQTGVCGGRAYKLSLAVDPSARVTAFSVDGVAWSGDELARWNRELSPIREDVVVRFECVARGDVVRVAGASAGGDANYLAVTASGGKRRWFGFTRERFQNALTPKGVESVR